MGAKRRWGYFIWIVAALVIGVPEITAAVDKDALPFVTISETVGHLERHHTWVELMVVGVVVFAIFSALRIPPRSRSGVETPSETAEPVRTPGGRLTVRPPAGPKPGEQFDDEEAPPIFAAFALAACAAVAIGTWAAAEWWDDANHFQPSYVLYGSLGLLWFVVPSLVAFFWGEDCPFPTAFRSVANLEDFLRKQKWPLTLGPALAWTVAYVIVAGFAILLLHLALYPYPDITEILNPRG